MAVTSIWRVNGWLGKVVVYVENPDKTTKPEFYENKDMTERECQGLDDVIAYAVSCHKTQQVDEEMDTLERFVSGINCHPGTAREEMMAVKKRFGKENGTIAYHGYQSFAPGEAKPEIAHKIGVELARRVWGEKYQVVVATHLDKANHLEEGIIDVNHTLIYYSHRDESYKRGCYYNVNTPKTKASTRQVPMLDFVKEAFIMEREYQEAMGIKCEVTIDGYTDFVFVNRFGTPQNLANLNKAIHRIIRDCNDEEFLKDENPAVLLPNFSCHSLRHTFTTRMCEAGVNVKVIQDALGHQDISTTLNIYADVTKELKQKEFAGLDMYFTKDKKSMSPLDQQ